MEVVKQQQIEQQQREKDKFEREERAFEREVRRGAMYTEDSKRQIEADKRRRQHELEMKRLEMRGLNNGENKNIGSFQAKPPKLQPFSKDREKKDKCGTMCE